MPLFLALRVGSAECDVMLQYPGSKPPDVLFWAGKANLRDIKCRLLIEVHC